MSCYFNRGNCNQCATTIYADLNVLLIWRTVIVGGCIVAHKSSYHYNATYHNSYWHETHKNHWSNDIHRVQQFNATLCPAFNSCQRSASTYNIEAANCNASFYRCCTVVNGDDKWLRSTFKSCSVMRWMQPTTTFWRDVTDVGRVPQIMST